MNRRIREYNERRKRREAPPAWLAGGFSWMEEHMKEFLTPKYPLRGFRMTNKGIVRFLLENPNG